ncbi:hypothetical protein CNMCM8980_009190 [Aspergillus fumigatiaffinis]|uniref:RRM domain-containing protein n=1 Tax=Aspergillus fumigatiaffinis TaxID=340414 RepID=A0A8H4H2U7_9EURO|nr:hypothetical protein CNMCM5878_009286 [Aspergillus fumigatiaffinis]KAF4224701.1 hypothetical protein CNMCM6457_009051 [Aspergillus fumigatiaffinis]KAF4233818.1 hypothetical protein CNMCM6805_009035 [Aspergillus fumigatiaffinis]KAF4245974.1 hypothetical protein CNMCM8980_009190 [Aspergillus fumigatiaffinis]
MNAIRQTQALNKRELENAVPPEASWHADYRDTAYIYIGGLPFDLSEGDIITIFSQYGEPVHVDLIRDKETGKSRGFAFLKYEDQRSTDLAVDNLTGATVLGRVLRVDHARYKKRDNEEDENNVAKLMGENTDRNARGEDTDDERRRKKRRSSESREDEARSRPLLKEERELQELMMNHDDEDPMKEYLIEEKKEEVARALERDRAAITAIVITVTKMRIDLVLGNVGIAVTGHYPERSVPTETDHYRREKNLTGRDRLCAPDPQYHEGIGKESIVDVDRDQMINGCCACPLSSD